MKDDAPQPLLPPVVVELLLEAVGAVLNHTRRAPAASPNGDEPKPEPEERLLTAQQAAERLSVPTDWLYRHAAELPFTVRLGDRFLRFREAGLNEFIRKRERDERRRDH
jgi:predicted DNA-binding transcriptional regulator AlpA